jgi:succinate dehydrogenase / fumarate reductase, cytochrome b subunit
MSNKNEIHARRPTSPHLGIYRWQISNTLSILHRLTGVGLFFGLSLICWWGIASVFFGYCEYILAFPSTIIFKLAVILSSVALFYHLSNGIRHLFWDAGCGYSLRAMRFSGYIVILTTILLSALLYFYVLS